MNAERTRADDSDDETEALEPTRRFQLLANERRRYVLHHLSRVDGAVSLDTLVDAVARLEGEGPYSEPSRIQLSLHTLHLPALEEAGVVTYDRDRLLVERADELEAMVPHLQLVEAADLE